MNLYEAKNILNKNGYRLVEYFDKHVELYDEDSINSGYAFHIEKCKIKTERYDDNNKKIDGSVDDDGHQLDTDIRHGEWDDFGELYNAIVHELTGNDTCISVNYQVNADDSDTCHVRIIMVLDPFYKKENKGTTRVSVDMDIAGKEIRPVTGKNLEQLLKTAI